MHFVSECRVDFEQLDLFLAQLLAVLGIAFFACLVLLALCLLGDDDQSARVERHARKDQVQENPRNGIERLAGDRPAPSSTVLGPLGSSGLLSGALSCARLR
jgi:hypothetical protein